MPNSDTQVLDQNPAQSNPAADPFGLEEARQAVLAEAEELERNAAQDAGDGTDGSDGGQTPSDADDTSDDATQDDAASGDKADDDKPKYTRRDAERLAKELLESQQKTAELQRQMQAQAQETEQLAGLVRKAIGTDEEYRAADRAMKHGATPQEREAGRQKVAIYDQNRDFYAKVFKLAESQVYGSVGADFERAAKELAGVDQQTLFGGKMFDVLSHVYEAGKKSVSDDKDAEIARLKAELKGAKAGALLSQ